MSGLLRDLAKKSIMVTGAGQGMGSQLVKNLVSVGAKVIAVDKNKDKLAELEGEAKGIKMIDVDLTDWNKTREKLGNVGQKLDGLVNCAGVTIVKPFLEFTEKEYEIFVVESVQQRLHSIGVVRRIVTSSGIFNVNIRAVFHVTQAVVPQMNECASIVNMSTLDSMKTFMGHTVYSASKSAVDALTRTLAFELAEKHIRVNSVHPTVVMTAMGKYAWSDPKVADPLLARIPMHRFCELYEVMDAICYLLGPRSSFVNGHHLLLEGGYSAA